MQPSDLSALIAPSCKEVLDAMLYASVLESTDTPPEAVDSNDHAPSLQFMGDLCGQFGVSCHRDAACSLAAYFLGEEEEAIVETVAAEVMGELANILRGSMPSRTGCTRTFSISHSRPATCSRFPSTGPATLFNTLNTDTGTYDAWILFNQSDPTAEHRGDE